MYNDDKLVKMSPLDYISFMFDKTDENGILYIEGWVYDGDDESEKSYRCRMDWNLQDYHRVSTEYENLAGRLKKIAEVLDLLSDNPEENKKLFEDDELFEVWHTYVRDFETEKFDADVIDEISDRLDTIRDVRQASKRVADGEDVGQMEITLLKDYIDVTVSGEERKMYDDYLNAIYADCERRVGDNICAYDVVIRAQRLCRLFSLNASKIVIDNEARYLAAAMVIHKFAKSKETVDNYMRLKIEAIENMGDDELDELYRPKKANNRKSMAPLFVYLVLKENSDRNHPLRQQEILNFLSKYPYEINIERKALSRIIHNLIDSNLGIESDVKLGTWFEK